MDRMDSDLCVLYLLCFGVLVFSSPWRCYVHAHSPPLKVFLLLFVCCRDALYVCFHDVPLRLSGVLILEITCI